MISSNGEVLQNMNRDMPIDDFYETTSLTNEDIAEILSSTNNMFMAENKGLDRISRSVEKPVKKRSRASTNTPTTFLIAKATDFRALVQQLTGCQSANSYKGPINLNFGAAEEDGMSNIDDKVPAVSMLEFNFFEHKTRVKNQQDDRQYQHPQSRDFDEDQRLYEEQESSSSFGSDGFDLQATYTSHGPNNYSMKVDDLAMENIFMNDINSLDFGEYDSLEMQVGDDQAIFCGDYSLDYVLEDEAILFCGYN